MSVTSVRPSLRRVLPALGLLACACASAPRPVVVEPEAEVSLASPPGIEETAEEAAAIEAAKRHPIAQTYERPRPAALPVPPAKVPAETAPAAPRVPDQVIIVGADPPRNEDRAADQDPGQGRPAPLPPGASPYDSAGLTPDYAPEPLGQGSVSYESDPGPAADGYVWLDGAWVDPAPPARFGVYVGSPGYRQRYWREPAYPPAVVVVPGGSGYYRPYPGYGYVAPPRYRHWHSDPYPARYRAAPSRPRQDRRRDVYVAPSRRPEPGRSDAIRAPSRPLAPTRAPDARRWGDSRGEIRSSSRGEVRGEIRGGSRGEAHGGSRGGSSRGDFRGSSRGGSSTGRRSINVGGR